MKRLILSLFCLGAALTASAQAVRPVSTAQAAPGVAQRYVDLVTSSDLFIDGQVGVLAVTVGGDTLVSHRSQNRLLPASNMKLISTGMALHYLGAGFRFETTLAYDGVVENGVLKGDLYIVGGGDPTLGAKDSIATPVNDLFARWKELLEQAGIRRIEGRIVGDGRYFDGPIEEPSWGYEDLGTYYATGGNGLCFYENVIDIKATPGAAVGDPVTCEVLYPNTPWMSWDFPCKTGPAGTGDELYLYTTDLWPVAQMRGTFAIDRKPKVEECSNKFGAMTCAYYFYKYLTSNGVFVSGGPADIGPDGRVREDLAAPFGEPSGTVAPAASALKEVGKTYSPELLKIIKKTNWDSDNFFAETLMRTLSVRERGTAVYDTVQVNAMALLERLGMDTSKGIYISDGSGLSRENYISPDAMVRFLRVMLRYRCFDDFVHSLAQPGHNGPYFSRLRGESEALKDRIYMKSGSMGGVRCYSGYVLPTSGEKKDIIIFSVMTNNVTAPTPKVLQVMDKIIALVASGN